MSSSLAASVLPLAAVVALGAGPGCNQPYLTANTPAPGDTRVTYSSLSRVEFIDSSSSDSRRLVPVLLDADTVPRRYRDVIQAIGLMSTGCTVTHIGHGVALTAGHCFHDGATLATAGSCDGVKVYWGVYADREPYLTSRCTTIVVRSVGPLLDYALFRVEPPPATAVLVDMRQRPVAGERLAMFGHPNGASLRWSGECKVESMMGASGGAGALLHDCSTSPGSSGSALIDQRTMKIIGVHLGGLMQRGYAVPIADAPMTGVTGS